METVNKQNSDTAQHFEHKTLKNADGTPVRARRNGKTKTWKTRPTLFKIPVKYGLKQCFYIQNFNDKDIMFGRGQHNNADEWNVVD